jgi:hypothetical protein
MEQNRNKLHKALTRKPSLYSKLSCLLGGVFRNCGSRFVDVFCDILMVTNRQSKILCRSIFTNSLAVTLFSQGDVENQTWFQWFIGPRGYKNVEVEWSLSSKALYQRIIFGQVQITRHVTEALTYPCAFLSPVESHRRKELPLQTPSPSFITYLTIIDQT